MKWRGEVNGLKAEAYYPDDFAGACLRMLRRFTAKYRETGKRQILFLAAPPGAGKSTLAAFLADLSRGDAQCEETRALGIDGFHLPRAALEGKSAVRNGITVPLREIRGAPETFDLEALTDALRRLKAGENILWPEYSRVLHDPVPGRLPVREHLVLAEGNYLLLDRPLWRDLNKFADHTMYLTADRRILRERLIGRKVRGGMNREDAEKFVDTSDAYNIRLVGENRLEADEIIQIRGGEKDDESIDRSTAVFGENGDAERTGHGQDTGRAS